MFCTFNNVERPVQTPPTLVQQSVERILKQMSKSFQMLKSLLLVENLKQSHSFVMRVSEIPCKKNCKMEKLWKPDHSFHRCNIYRNHMVYCEKQKYFAHKLTCALLAIFKTILLLSENSSTLQFSWGRGAQIPDVSRHLDAFFSGTPAC